MRRVDHELNLLYVLEKNNNNNNAKGACAMIDIEVVQPKAKRRRLHKNWVLENSFDSKNDSTAAVNAENDY